MFGRLRAGFTLVELMVTMVLSIVIIGAVYLLYTQSVSAYRMENQVLDMQDRLRFGMEHLKRDMRRAAFLATPYSTADPNVWPKPPDALRAVTISANTGSVFRATDNVNIEPSAITLFGDFFSGKIYPTAGIQDDTVFLQLTDDFPATEVEFNRVFNPYPGTAARYLRIVTQDQFEIYSAITDADWAQRSIIVSQTIPVSGGGALGGITGFGEGLDANVAGFVRYVLMSDTRPNAPDGKTDLVREELTVDGVASIDNSQLVIADYAVDMQFYDFGMVAPGGDPTQIVRYDFVSDVSSLLGDGASPSPHMLRYLTVKLTVMSESEDPDFAFIARADENSPIHAFQMDDMSGACRTFSLASRVQFPTLAVRNLTGGTP